MVGFLLLLAASAIFAFDTALSNKNFIYSGGILRINEQERIIYLGEAGSSRSLNIRYHRDTEFTQAHHRVVPSSKISGRKAQVYFRKSLFSRDYAFRVELSD